MCGKNNNQPNKAKDRKTFFSAFILDCYSSHSPSPSTQATPSVGSLVLGWGSIFGENIQAPTMRGKAWGTLVLIPGVCWVSVERGGVSYVCHNERDRWYSGEVYKVWTGPWNLGVRPLTRPQRSASLSPAMNLNASNSL